MNIGNIVKKIDAWQQRHRTPSFAHAVFKKYSDDNGGYQAALLTYYGFLSIFPLLMVLVTLVQIWFNNDPILRHDISQSIGHFFPVLGDQLEDNIHGKRRAVKGQVICLLITLYGARGAADAFRFTVDNMWQIPRSKRAGFPKSMLHSLAIMGAATAGFGATVAVSAFTADLGHATWVKVVANIAGAGILVVVIGYAFRIATLGRLRMRYMLLGATIAGIGIQLLLSFGSIVLAHELHNLNSLYGTFAVVLGILFWIYLLAQVVLFSAEIDTVRHFHLWPRSLSGKLKTDADHAAEDLFAQEDKYLRNSIRSRLRR
jgi:YihY family inner membrane protein